MNLAYYNTTMNGLGETTQDFLTNTAAQAYSASKSGSDSGAKVGVTIAGAVSSALAAGGPSAVAITSVLTGIGIGAQAVPVIGTVLGGLALIGGALLAGRAKAKAIKGQISEVNQQTSQYQSALNDLDNAISKTEQAKAQALAELKRLGIFSGLNGMGSIGSWIKQTFTPGAYYGDKLANANTQLEIVSNQYNARLEYAAQLETDLKTILKQLTSAKLKKAAIVGGLVIGSATLIYFSLK
jgi:hypothetical protein